MKRILPAFTCCFFVAMIACSTKDKPAPDPDPPALVGLKSIRLNGVDMADRTYGAARKSVVEVQFTTAVLPASVTGAVQLTGSGGQSVAVNTSLQAGDATLLITPAGDLMPLSSYKLVISNALKSAAGGNFTGTVNKQFLTGIDSTDKFPVISDDSLLTLVQKKTFNYFWNSAASLNGMARERNSSGNTVTSGGSGFGFMATVVAAERGFITRDQALASLTSAADFLLNKAGTVKGAFPHWLDGTTGAIIPFSQKDDGADIVETSYVVMGLITAREYFKGVTAAEQHFRQKVNAIVDRVEWDFFRRDDGNVLYWHYSNNYGWDMNLPIRGWNECLITYVMAASSTTHGIPPTVYTQGWVGTGYTNGKQYYGYTLPLGPDYGGPLFFSHYSFMGIDPNGLHDIYANYKDQIVAHSNINHAYCADNPLKYYGYSGDCWGLTASDIPGGYSANSPVNDLGVIAPTAALSSFPFTPEKSMAALKFFYYKLGDKLFTEQGFVDAFKLQEAWFADSFLAIDQGPVIVMIENHRTGLLWKLFTNAPEVKAGMRTLGFTAPYL